MYTQLGARASTFCSNEIFHIYRTIHACWVSVTYKVHYRYVCTNNNIMIRTRSQRHDSWN